MFRVFPAPAGINRWQSNYPITSARVPRASGDKLLLILPATDSSVFPAPAGINRKICREWFHPAGVPRASGDKPFLYVMMRLHVACSPRQRG
ncbi:hypothetical protein G7E71_001633 [Escherichia coli]|nr:hypothetical protein [Escherichia coli]